MRNFARRLAVFVSFIAVLWSADARAATTGDRDPDFNGGKPVTVTSPSEPTAGKTEKDTVRDAVVDGSGRITVGGTAQPDSGGASAFIARLQNNGSFDPSFGSGGKIFPSQYGGSTSLGLAGLFRNSAGRLQAGFSADAGPLGAAYNSAGALLTGSYGPNGTGLSSPVTGGGQELLRAVGAADGSTYFVERDTTLNTGAQTGLFIARLDPDGNRDLTYGPHVNNQPVSFAIPRDYQGASQHEVGVNGSGYVDAAVDSTGRLVIATTAIVAGKRGVYVMRFTAQGQPDSTFGTSGHAFFQGSDTTLEYSADAVAIGPNSTIAITGGYGTQASSFGWATLKLQANGTLDPSFGYQTSAINQLEYEPTAVAVQSDGKVLAVEGGAAPGGAVNIARYNTNGSFDTSFSGDGVATDNYLDIDQYDLRVTNAIITPNGSKLLVVGRAAGNGSQITQNDDEYPGGHGFVARYLLSDPAQTPENLTAPTVTGVPAPNHQLSCSAGTWKNGPAITVTWQRVLAGVTNDDDPAWDSGNTGVTGTTYNVTSADLGSRVRCVEHANKQGYSEVLQPSGSKRVSDGVPVLQRAPTVSGIPVTGGVLTCDRGDWTNDADLAVQWLRDGAAIPSATDPEYTLQFADARHQVGCQVTASNDVGPAGAPAKSGTLLVVHDVPKNLTAPNLTSATTGGKATDIRLTCGDGSWDEDYGQYDFAWFREGAQIAGAAGKIYDATTDDLGRNLTCQVFSTNPRGRSDGATSNVVLVPLPANVSFPGKIYKAGGFNQVDPTNLMAVSYYYQHAINNLVSNRRANAVAATKKACSVGPDKNASTPTFDTNLGKTLSARQTCGVLLNESPFDVISVQTGTFWNNAPFACHTPDDSVPYGKGLCPKLAIDVPPLDSTSPLSDLSAAEQQQLSDDQPLQVLWDFDSDGHTDASCDGSAPILRSLYSRGIYKVRAVIVSKYSASSGFYDVIDYDLSHFPTSPAQKGSIRNGQPFACKTSLAPPEEPQQPCINEVTFGRVHVTGNLCPISARRIPPNEFDGLPGNVQQMLTNQALNGPLNRRRIANLMPTTFGDTRVGGLPALPSASNAVATAQVSALSTLDQAVPATIPASWQKGLNDVKSFNPDQAQRAMDQIYVANGTSMLNGVKMDPIGAAKTMLVPSDAGAAIDGIKQMTVSSTNLATSLGGIPIGDPGKFTTDLKDKLTQDAKTEAEAQAGALLKSANLDSLAQSLKSKLDLGPFKLAGDAKVKLNNDGTATIDAYAELPKLLTKPGSSPIRVSVKITASREGKLTLNGIHLNAPAAYLGGILIKDLALDYDDNGLSIVGKLLFPPVNQGIAINKFRLDSHGNFQELDVDYLAGAGQGINIGPGIFLVKLGGGLSLNPDEIRARAGVSVGPSATGGGCPTAGIDAQMTVHFSPDPFFVDATGTVGLVCIPIGNAHFYADTTGLIDLGASVNLDIGPLYISGGFDGRIQLPRWQVDLHGDGGIRHVIEASIKALIGNLGIAGCGRVEVFPSTPLTDSVTIAAGAGVRFPDGIPPLSFPALIANARIFTGCDLKPWSPFGRNVRAAGDGGGRTFTVDSKDPVLALQLTGTGGSPRVNLTAPDGKTYDATQLGTDFTRGADVSGLRDEEHNQTVVFLHGQKGAWTATPAAGTPALADVQHAAIVPDPKVTAKVGGAGASRILSYRVAKIPGQVVHFVEQGPKGIRPIKTVKGGGSGSVHFVTSEGGGSKRTVTAQIAQDGLPRDNIVVAHFTAPSPRAGKAQHLKLRRKGSKATATWGKSFYTKRYTVTVQTGDGHRYVLTPRARTVTFGGLSKGEGATVSVTSIAASGRHGGTATATLKGAKHYSGFKNKKRPKVKKHKKHKRK